MSGGNSTNFWKTIQRENEKVPLQYEGEQLYGRPTDDGKIRVGGADGNVKSVSDIVTPVDQKGEKVIDIANHACDKNSVKFERVIVGVKVNVLLGAVYCLIISGTHSTGASKVFFTAVFERNDKKIVLFFEYVPPPF